MGMTMPGDLHFPDPLVTRAHRILARFASPDDAALPGGPAAAWDRLKGDFATVVRPEVPGFAGLTRSQRDGAMAYLAAQVEMNVCLAACSDAHGAVIRSGFAPALIERYAEAREAYEESVEHFGALRASLSALLG